MLRIALMISALSFLSGCAEDDARGTLQVMLRGETTIADGLEAGDGTDEVVDGWDVRFETWIATVGYVHLDRADGEAGAQESHEVRVVDLRSVPSSGIEIARFEGITAGRWDVFEFETPSAREQAEPDEGVSDDELDALIEADATYLIEGVLTSQQGRSCPPGGECRDASEVRFSFAVPAETHYGPCTADRASLAGAVVNEGGITTVAITLHGDHVFFDRFPVGAEDVERRAQWLADSDLNGDGLVTQAELEMIDAADLLVSATHTLGGGPSDIAIHTVWDYVRAQLKTVGHFQGEGECPVDGREHEH